MLFPTDSPFADFSDLELVLIALLTLNGQGISEPDIVRLIQGSRLTNLDGTKIVVREIKAALQGLVEIGEIGKDHLNYEPLYHVDTIDCWETVSYLLVRTNGHGTDSLDPIVSVLSPDYFFQPSNTFKYYIGRIRIALITGKTGEKLMNLQQRANHCLTLRRVPIDDNPVAVAAGHIYYPNVVERFSFTAQHFQFRNILANFLYYPGNLDGVLVASRQFLEKLNRGDAYTTLRNLLCEALLFSGDVEVVMDVVSEDSDPDACAFDAAARFISGDQDGALKRFDDWMALTGSAPMLPGLRGFLYPLCQLTSGDSERISSGRGYLKNEAKKAGNQSSQQIYAAIQVLFDAHDGFPSSALPAVEVNDLGIVASLFRSLVAYWIDLPFGDVERERLRRDYTSCCNLGLYWAAAQFTALVAEIGDGELGGNTEVQLRQHALADATAWVERKPLWKRQIAALRKFGRTGNETNDLRIAWVVWLDETRPVHVEAREQKQSARGAWSKGKAVGLTRLLTEHNDMAHFTAQDVEVLAAVSPPTQFGSREATIDSAKASLALIGHPNVFLAEDNGLLRIELVRHAPTCQVRVRGDNFEVSLDPMISDNSPAAILVRDTLTRYKVVAVNRDQRKIGAMIGPKIAIPSTEVEEVRELVKSLSANFTVETDIVDAAAGVVQREADARLHIHLLPHKDGLRMQVLVRPIPDAGPYFVPGAGGENVTADIEGTPVQARRALQSEVDLATGLIARCSPLVWIDQIHSEWTIEDPYHCLEILLQLQCEPEDSLVIAWPEGVRFKLGNLVGHQQFSMNIRSERDWFAANGELTIDEGRVLELTELLRGFLAGRGKFISLGGNEFIALTDEFHRRLQDMSAFGELSKDGVRFSPLSSFALKDFAKEMEEAQALQADEQWHEHIARMSTIADYRAKVPSTLHAELRDYQREGFEWLAQLAHWGVGACLADDMGLGKTVQSIALLLDRAAGGPALVVAPTSVCMNWVSELRRFAPTLNVREFGKGNREQTLAELGAFDVVVATYGLMQQEQSPLLGIDWHTVILDEAQAIKNAGTMRSQAAMKLRGEFRIACSGTPVENNLGELWNLFRFTNPGLLGSRESFNKKYAGPIERSGDPDSAAAARARLKRLVQPFILRRTKSMVLTELPSRTEITLPVELSDQERTLYESLRRSAVEAIAAASGSPGEAAIKALAELMKLRRACCNPNLVAAELSLASSKLEAFGQLMEELLANKHKALVFSQFVDHLSLIRELLDARGVKYQYLDGSTPMLERKKRVDAFQGGDADVFLISLKAGGVGINLTAADYVIHMDPWWNPAVEDQASDRAHRMGQLRPVTIYRLVAQHTIEESIVDLHRNKRALADSLLDGTNKSASMSAAEIVAILDRKWDA